MGDALDAGLDKVQIVQRETRRELPAVELLEQFVIGAQERLHELAE